MAKINTVRDARIEKLNQDAKLEARDNARAARFTIPSNLHPAEVVNLMRNPTPDTGVIRVTISADGVAFYAVIGGLLFSGSVDALTAKLQEVAR